MIADWAHDRDASEQVKRIYVQQLLQNDPQVMLGDYLACDRFDLRADLERIPTPALVICGMEDVMTPPRYGEYLAEHLPDATLVQVERAGHMVMFEAPDETAAAVSRFLSGLQPAG
jgi:pimeloyl-ACP methyl ester carboxylesterase